MSDPSRRPLVSIVLCLYNGEEFLAATLDSIFAQTITDFELIVVDDGSTDGSGEVLARYCDQRLRIVHQANQGASAALDAGLRIAGGSYVCFMDQDDLWMPDKLAAHVDLHEGRPDIDLSFSWFRIIDRASQEIGICSSHSRGTIDFPSLLTDFVIGAWSNVMIRRAALAEAGGVDCALSRFYDIDICLRVSRLRPYNVQAIPRNLMLYRRHSNQISGQIPPLQREWNLLLDKMRRLDPQLAAELEGLARSNMNRYFACLAYENDQFLLSLQLLAQGFLKAPGWFLIDTRNWKVGTAALCGLLLPGHALHALERLAGLRRE